ncbi:MAG: RsmD family RNA methyltransferase [Alphaproteobacteria bacterium]
MRIVGGRHRGQRIAAPAGHAVRPTGERAREAVFNLLENGRAVSEVRFVLKGSSVLDAFCGSGALGLEALSRGAGFATFLDVDKAALAAAKTNAGKLGEISRCAFLRADLAALPSAPRAHSLAFLDPPYGKALVAPALAELAAKGWLAEGAVCVVERGAGEGALELPAPFVELDCRRYGAGRIDFIHYPGPRAA